MKFKRNYFMFKINQVPQRRKSLQLQLVHRGGLQIHCNIPKSSIDFQLMRGNH